MKCKICGDRFNTIKAMGAHYRKKHPYKMKHGRKRGSSKRGRRKGHYCSECGRSL